MDYTQLLTRRNIIFLSLVLIIGIIAWIAVTVAPFKSIEIHQTPFKSNEFTALQNGKLYSYNGTAFYKTNPENKDEVAVLNTGMRLPLVKSLHWAGDEGAFMTFDDGSYISSLVEQQLTARGQEWDDTTRAYVWYVDFKASTLRLVSEEGLVDDVVYYSKKNGGAYYIGYGNADENGGLLPKRLLFYSTSTHTSNTVSENISYDIVKHVGSCLDSKTICLVALGESGEVIRKVSSNKVEVITKGTFDFITPTASPDVFIGTRNINKDSDGEVLQADTYYINVRDNKSSKVDATVNASDSVLANTVSDNAFYIFEPTPLGDRVDTKYISVAKNIFGAYRTTQKTLDRASSDASPSRSLVGPLSYSENGLAVFNDIDGSTFLITPSDYSYQEPGLSSSEADESLKNCFDRHTNYHEYSDELKQFKVGINYDTDFQGKIKTFSNCAAKESAKAFVGHSFVFIGISPFDGRFVTD